MAVEGSALKVHPGRNPSYDAEMEARREAQAHNRRAREYNTMQEAMGTKMRMPLVPVPRQPNKYVPHQGRKELARHVDR